VVGCETYWFLDGYYRYHQIFIIPKTNIRQCLSQIGVHSFRAWFFWHEKRTYDISKSCDNNIQRIFGHFLSRYYWMIW
jgi:hypothetical protein